MAQVGILGDQVFLAQVVGGEGDQAVDAGRLVLDAGLPLLAIHRIERAPIKTLQRARGGGLEGFGVADIGREPAVEHVQQAGIA
ncbi:hypothetical protein D3C71_1148740 [compost metagenome]